MKSVRDPVHAICQHGLKREGGITITTTIPQQPAELITLFPVPFEMGERELKTLERRGWGTIKKIHFGTLRNYQKIKNGYVNLYIHDPDYLRIAGQVNIMGHWISVTTPHNRHLPMCRFCKTRGHEIGDCAKLWRKNQQRSKETMSTTEQIKSSSSEEDKENHHKGESQTTLQDFVVVGKKRPRISPKNKKKEENKKQKK